MGKKSVIVVLLSVILLAALLPLFRSKEIKDQAGNSFAGSASCARCHQKIAETYAHTDHFWDSREADSRSVKGKFVRDSDYVMFNYDPNNIVVMHKRFGSLYQTHYLNNEKRESREFDIAIGSGRKGQSYLYWDKGRLFELPVSYYTPEDQWVVSPGYSSQHVDFKRMVTPRCLECHTTYAQFTEDTLQHTAQFGKNQMIYGITCEKCHGPGGRHVEFQEANPAEKTARYIVRTKQLSRDLQMDACGMCHAGAMKNILPAFTFRPGLALSKYYEFKERKDSTADVHGNQVQLLSSSKCYKMGDGMSCSTCHDVHANHRGDLAFYAGKCITCHSDYKALHQTDVRFADQVLLEKCIDCHMPNLPSKVMNMNSDLFARTKPVLIRSHLIKIYQGKSNAILGGQ
jgi:hypothetical protein